jgi:hypothetical protein
MTHEQFLSIATDIVAYIASKRPLPPPGRESSQTPPSLRVASTPRPFLKSRKCKSLVFTKPPRK